MNRPGGRKGGLWDEEQVRAYVAGEPIPPLPTQEDPDDLLDAAEVGELAGIAATTVLRYLLREKPLIPEPDEEVHGQPHWRRQTIVDWLPKRPGRGAGGGRRTASGASDEELAERALQLREEAAGQGRKLGVRELGRALGVSPSKASKILASLPSAESASAPPAVGEAAATS